MLGARWLLAAVWLFAPVTSHSQALRTDSLRILNSAHDAQNRFERIRRHFVRADAETGDDRCDTPIGRMCYWQPDAHDSLPAEPRQIRDARLSLDATLARLNEMSPGDDWIVGERVRYLIEGGDDSAAVLAARTCSPPRWYCIALRGYAFHAAAQYAAAAAAFDSALAAMPATERCRWNDISLLLDKDERDKYDQIPCGSRDSLERRFWELARPSFLVNGNDRRTEHFSRVMLADLSETAANAFDMRWDSDMRELTIRYGSPVWYTRPPAPAFGVQPAAPVVGHERSPSFHFVADTGDGGPHWDPYAREAREQYAPPYMDTLTTLDAQFAMMKRGDSALVIAVYAHSAGDSIQHSAVLGISGIQNDSAARSAAAGDSTDTRIWRAHALWKGMMVTMEKFDPARRLDARARQWLAPPPHVAGAPDISTLLLFSADTAESVATLDDAVKHALTQDRLRDTRRLGVYWEVYRDSAGSAVHADSAADDSTGSSSMLTVVRTDGGVMRWLGQALHVTPGDSPITAKWRDGHGTTGAESHSVVLDLSALPAGRYRVTVAVGPDSTHRTESSRQITLQ